MKYYFYTLSEPDTKEVRYVGVTTYSLKTRYAQHKHNAIKGKDKTHKSKWFKAVLDDGMEPIIDLIKVYECDDNSWEQVEKDLILSYPNLTNHHQGGRGVIKGERLRTSELNSKKVVKIHPWKNIILETFQSATQAEKELYGTKTGVISQTVNGLHKQSGGFRWSFLEPLIFPEPLPYLFLYSNGAFIKDYSSKKEFRDDLTRILNTYNSFTLTNVIPTIST